MTKDNELNQYSKKNIKIREQCTLSCKKKSHKNNKTLSKLMQNIKCYFIFFIKNRSVINSYNNKKLT